MMKALEKLHDRHQIILDLRGYGLTQKQIAERIGVAKTTVYWHIKREEARLAKSFAAPIEKDWRQ